MIIAVASGKGGTGKTTVAVNLALAFGSGVQVIDCDVEAPNARLFLKGPVEKEKPVWINVPRVKEDLCDACGACSDFCEFNAIVTFGTKPLVFDDLCHGCGGCTRVCPAGAIYEEKKEIGKIIYSHFNGMPVTSGLLEVGSALAPPVIRAAKEDIDPGMPVIIDSPPGTSCPMIASVIGSDAVVLVTEPTPFGLHDLNLALDTATELNLPCGVVINRSSALNERVYEICRRFNIPVFGEIKEDRRVAEIYASGNLVYDALPEYREVFQDLKEKILEFASGHRGNR